MMRILITGASGFIGKNLVARLSERASVEIMQFTRESTGDQLAQYVEAADCIFHLAGINRPLDDAEFISGNVELTSELCQLILKSGRHPKVVYTSSIQAEKDSAYGSSKLAAENALAELNRNNAGDVHIFRLPNVFGKWCKPNYNSAVATFCHNISRGLDIQINDPNANISLVYIDDVIDKFLEIIDGVENGGLYVNVPTQYESTVGKLAEQIYSFKNSRQTLETERVGTGLVRALYATYVSYLRPEDFSYGVPQHGDPRGVFVEMLKTSDSGQFSYFTAHPGITRGGHYHHSKTEKFLVIRGTAKFGFRHIQTNQYYVLHTSGDKPEIVETVPGWTHDITNVGDEEMIVMLWANEIFDRDHPDTYARPVNHEKT